MELYPFKFETIYKEKIWGGSKIKDVLGKDFSPLSNCGETWELSGVEGNISLVSNGPLKGKDLKYLINQYKEDLVGQKVYNQYNSDFPLLVKFIDAKDDLSIQVHPNDEQAKKHNSFGKSEMWYILQADEVAELYVGFEEDVDQHQFKGAVDKGEALPLFHKEKVHSDDVFYIPAGRVHSIGKGILLAEIQQSSDITYRIYDFDRVDAQGRKRDLHVDQALEVIDFERKKSYKSNQPTVINTPQELVKNSFFTTNRLIINEPHTCNYTALDSFKILTCIEGNAYLQWDNENFTIQKGDVILIPANLDEILLTPSGTFSVLETFIS